MRLSRTRIARPPRTRPARAEGAARQIACGLALVAALAGCTSIDFSASGGGASGGAAPAGGGPAAGAGPGSGGAGGGAIPTMDVCGNGLDDDQDGATDCDDSDCTLICEELPPGWTGFVSVSPDGCGPSQTLAETAYLSASGSTACDCTCGSPTCMAITGQAYSAAGCNAPGGTEQLNANCKSLGTQGSDSYQFTDNSTCGNAGAALSDPSVSTSAVSLCVDAAGTCVYQSGLDVPCPKGFPNPTGYFTDVIDSRACGPQSCACAASCWDAQYWVGDQCVGTPTVVTPGVCIEQVGKLSVMALPKPQPACAATGSATGSGAVSLDGPITVCCR